MSKEIAKDFAEGWESHKEERQRQIEEMAKIIYKSVDRYNPCDNEEYGGFACLNCDYLEKRYCQHDVERANGLYNAGYRKASDVAREIFEEIEKSLKKNRFNGITCFLVNIAELKKKYTEGAK